MRKIVGLLAVFVLTAAIVQAAFAGTETASNPPATGIYCLNGQTTTMPAPISFGNGSITVEMHQASADIIAAGQQGFTNGIFYLGYSKGTTEVFLFTQDEYNSGQVEPDPAPSLNTIAFGACTAAAAPATDRQFWLCYSTGYPWVGSRADAMKLYDDGNGWKVPVAVRDDAANGPHIGNGLTLSCNFGAYPTLSGQAFSTGQGEAFDSVIYAKVPAGNRLDYTQLAGK
jgi:hypothetical protein